MTLMIQKRFDTRHSAIFLLSGQIRAEDLPGLRTLLDQERRGPVIDLKEVNLVDRESVKFLKRCQADGVELRNCPPYVRKWILKEDSEEAATRAPEEE
jgi:hypothetical protein